MKLLFRYKCAKALHSLCPSSTLYRWGKTCPEFEVQNSSWFWTLISVSLRASPVWKHLSLISIVPVSTCCLCWSQLKHLSLGVEEHTFNVTLKWFVQQQPTVTTEAKTEAVSLGCVSLLWLLILSLDYQRLFMPSSFCSRWAHKLANTCLLSQHAFSVPNREMLRFRWSYPFRSS